MAIPIGVIMLKFREIYPTGNRRNCALFTFGCLSKCRYCADCAQNLLGPVPNNVLTVLQI